MNKIFAIQNCGISGTVFVQSLFDGHPKVLSMPGLTAQTLLIFWERHPNLNKEQLLENFLNEFVFLFQITEYNKAFGLHDMGINKNEDCCIDKNTFVSNLSNLPEWKDGNTLTRKHFIVAVFKAYNQTIGRPIADDSYILYPIHCLPKQYAEHLAEDFDDVTFLHMMRESIQNVGSMASHISKNKDWNKCYLLSCCISQIFLDRSVHVGYRDAHGLNPYIPNNPKCKTQSLKLEDVHKEPKVSLQKICTWLNIEWDDCLLSSTFNGKLWHNRPETIRQTGIGTQTISQKHDHLLNNFDRFRLNHLAAPYKQFYGYENKNAKPSNLTKIMMPFLLMLPFKMELMRGRSHNHLVEYVKCRLKFVIPAWFRTLKHNTYIELLK